jgi:hypothetical protein
MLKGDRLRPPRTLASLRSPLPFPLTFQLFFGDENRPCIRASAEPDASGSAPPALLESAE